MEGEFMSLRIYRGINSASQGSENEFFDELAGKLRLLFDDNNFDGVLLGHPKLKDERFEKLCPDCLLLVPYAVIIVDFKRYGGSLILPNENNWEYGEWINVDEHGHEIRVGGGSSRNPFLQLRYQQNLLKEALGIGFGDITTGVCFHGGTMTIIKSGIPNKYSQRFFIADINNYVQKIFNYINIRRSENPFPLSVDIMRRYLELFNVAEYDDFKHYTDHDLRNIKQNDELKNAIEKYRGEVAEINRVARQTNAAAKSINESVDELHRTIAHAKSAASRAETSVDKAGRYMKYAVVAIVALLIIVVGVVLLNIHNQRSLSEQVIERKEQNEQDEAKKRAEQIINGEICMRPDEAADYVGQTGVCVEYYVNYVNTTNYGYAWISDKKGSNFSAFVQDDKVISRQEAYDYRNKTIEVHGDITEYDNDGKVNYQIKIGSKDQIKIKSTD